MKPQPVKPQPMKPQPMKPQTLKPQPMKPQPLRPQPLKPGIVPASTPLTSTKKGGLKPLLAPEAEEPKEISEEAASIASEISQVDANEYLPVQDEYLAEEIHVEEEQEEEEEELVEKIQRGAPPWFLSTIGHVILILIGALIFSAVPPQPRPIVIECVMEVPEEEIQEEEEIWNEEVGVQQELETETASPTEEPEVSEMAEEDNPVDDPMLEPESAPESEEGTLAVRLKEAPVGARFNGRNPGGRKGLLGRYGGTKSTEDAVELGLQWLVKQQEKKGPNSGSWSLEGPYSDGLDDCPNRIAATAMALLAFQGAGYTQHPPKIEEKDRKSKKRYERKLKEIKDVGKYRQVVATAWNWLLKQQGPDGQFTPKDGMYNHPFYTHAHATIALCELYGMTTEARYRKPAENAVAYLLSTQHTDGAWRYTPQKDEMSDLSVTGWVLMALQSARMAGLNVPQEALDGITRYLDANSAANDQTYYRYTMEETYPSMTMTAEGILCRQYLGWEQNDPRMEKALTKVLTEPVSFKGETDVYKWYYATQAMHHKEGHWWTDWNAIMRQELPSHQIKKGPETGSWDPSSDRFADAQGGRLYMTCLSIYMLEVYYRHLPIYAKLFDENGKMNLDAVPAESSEEPAAAPAAQPAAPEAQPAAQSVEPADSDPEKTKGAIDTPENITGNFE